MRKVFLSHSSKNKGFVKKVAEQIGFDNCVYDEYTFEDGMKTLDEIYKGLDLTDIFVFFISDISLDSEWVKKECNRAKNLLNKKSILRFYPIIIDSSINYDDDRIPKWMKESYNIRNIASPIIAANKIKSRMREIIWNDNPNVKKRNQFFFGRNEEIKTFEERRADFDLPDLKCIVAYSGFDGMGRKAFISYALKKGNIMLESYEYNLICLERHESIEDFILKIADLGSGGINVSEIIEKTLEEKISLASTILNEIGKHNEYVFIDDQGVIVRPNSKMVDWFIRILDQIDNKIILCIASIYSLHYRNSLIDSRDKNSIESTFSIQIKELNVNERKLLLKEYCQLEKIEISKEQMKIVSSNLSGYPEQVFYAVQMIKDEGIEYTIGHLHEIREYADLKAQIVLDNYLKNEEEIKFLVFLASFDFVGYEILNTVFEKKAAYKEYLQLFLKLSICERLGTDGEYIRVNDVLKDIVFRKKLKMGKELEAMFKGIVDQTVNDNFVNESDLASYYSVVRSKIENGEIDQKYIIPSHYLKCIVKNYNRRFYDKSSRLCKHLIEECSLVTFDKEIVNDIYYYYSQSLAREHKSDEFFKTIGYEGFKIEDRLFLIGFYYRINGNPKKAIENLTNAIKTRSSFPKARRELANAYLAAEDYEEAERLCEANYGEDSRNPYYIQPYFESIIHRYTSLEAEQNSENIDLMTKLLDKMKMSDITQSKQMYYCMLAEFHAYITKDFEEAMTAIEQGLLEAEDSSIYLYLAKFDIANKFNNIDMMRKTLLDIEKIVEHQKYFLNALNIREARFYYSIGDKLKALQFVNKVINMPEKTMKKLTNEIKQ